MVRRPCILIVEYFHHVVLNNGFCLIDLSGSYIFVWRLRKIWLSLLSLNYWISSNLCRSIRILNFDCGDLVGSGSWCFYQFVRLYLQGVSLARRFALVPLGPPLLAYKSNCKAMLKAVGDNVQLEVDRAYKADDPISVWYVMKFLAYQKIPWIILLWNSVFSLIDFSGQQFGNDCE